jgi:two-component system, chemotaxis family, protein-glutamate methylesterase/glutaminase
VAQTAQDAHPDIVAIGASAGGLEAMEALLMRLPASLPAAILIVLHRPLERASYLPEILQRLRAGPVVIGREKQPLEHGICYLGLPDRHLTVGPGALIHLLPDGFYRGHNIDALFQSLAHHAGPRTIGVILSGMLKDGSLGLRALKQAGGVTLVQNPEDAAFQGMPQSAIDYDGSIDFVGSTEEIAEEICRRVTQSGCEATEGSLSRRRFERGSL